MGLFRRRPAVEPLPVVIVKAQPPRRVPWVAIAGVVLLAGVAAAQLSRASAQPAPAHVGASAPALVFATPDPTREPSLEAAIAAADTRYSKRADANDAKCDSMTDVDAGAACIERSTAILEEQTRFDECASQLLRVVDVARCEKDAAHP